MRPDAGIGTSNATVQCDTILIPGFSSKLAGKSEAVDKFIDRASNYPVIGVVQQIAILSAYNASKANAAKPFRRVVVGVETSNLVRQYFAVIVENDEAIHWHGNDPGA